MKKKYRIRLPVSAFLLLATVIIAFTGYLSLHIQFLPSKFVYAGALLSMPEGLFLTVRNAGDNFLEKINGLADVTIDYFQKDGSVNDIETKRQFRDLTVTPDDIQENEKILSLQFNNGQYDSDGTVLEKTYVTYQATDSFENVYVRNVTVNSDIDVQGIIENGCELPSGDYSEPTVLIYHTHSTEGYIPIDNGKFSSSYPERNSDSKLNMIRVGEEIAAVLTARGIGVVHDTTVYDTVYTGAYNESRAGITEILERYPSIVITLDIHRDAIYYDDLTRVKPIVEINGVKAAQMMIIAGAEGGNVDDFPSWETNLSFALNLQKAVNTEYADLMKPVYFCNRKYNMDITPYSLLIEVGTDVNTLSEAAYSGRLLGDVLAEFIKENMRESEK